MITSHQYRSVTKDGLCTYRWHVKPCNRPKDDHEPPHCPDPVPVTQPS